MFIYLMVLLPLLGLVWVKPSSKRTITFGYVLYFIILAVFMGLRDRTGPDWTGYLNIYEVINSSADFAKTEIIFAYLNVLSSLLGLYVYGVNVVCTLIFLIGIFSYANRTARPWLAVAAVTPYLCFVIGMSGIRQAAAIGIIFLALAHWSRISTLTKLAFIAAAMGFHASAGIMLGLVLLDNPRWFWLKAGFGGLLVGYMVMGASGADSVQMYNNRYIANNMQSTGSVQHVLLCAFPGLLYLIFKKRIEKAGWGNSLVTIGAIGSLVALPLTLISSTGVDRLALYFSYVQMWTYPALAVVFKSSEAPYLFSISALILSIFLIYFTMGTTLAGFIPYHSLLAP